MTWGENEQAMMPDMAATAAEMLEAAGAKNIAPVHGARTACPGYGIHEMGIARMGADPKTSVLNQFCQTHDVKNLFVMDALVLRLERLPEPDADDHGARRALDGLPDGGDEGGDYLTGVMLDAECRMQNPLVLGWSVGFGGALTTLHPTSASDIRHPTSDIRHPASDIRHPTSGIRHPSMSRGRGHLLRLLLGQA